MCQCIEQDLKCILNVYSLAVLPGPSGTACIVSGHKIMKTLLGAVIPVVAHCICSEWHQFISPLLSLSDVSPSSHVFCLTLFLDNGGCEKWHLSQLSIFRGSPAHVGFYPTHQSGKVPIWVCVHCVRPGLCTSCVHIGFGWPRVGETGGATYQVAQAAFAHL